MSRLPQAAEAAKAYASGEPGMGGAARSGARTRAASRVTKMAAGNVRRDFRRALALVPGIDPSEWTPRELRALLRVGAFGCRGTGRGDLPACWPQRYDRD